MDENRFSVDFTKNNEGLRLKAYKDTKGIKTIGYGHNLKASGENLTNISQNQAENFFNSDYNQAEQRAKSFAGNYYDSLSDLQKGMLKDFTFQIGNASDFKKSRALLQAGDETGFAQELLNSKYGKDPHTKDRALKVANLFLEEPQG